MFSKKVVFPGLSEIKDGFSGGYTPLLEVSNSNAKGQVLNISDTLHVTER